MSRQETDEVDDNADSVPDNIPENEVEEVPGDAEGPAEVDPVTSERATVEDDNTDSVPDNVLENEVEEVTDDAGGPAEVDPVTSECATVEDNVSAPTTAGSDEESCSKADLCKDSDEHGVDAEECQPIEIASQDKSIMNEGSSKDNETEMTEKICDALSDDSEDGNRRNETKKVCVADIVKACLDSIVERVLLIGSGDESKNSTDDVSHKQARNPISEVQLISNQHSEESEFKIIQGCLDHMLSMVVDNCAEDTPTEQHGKHPVMSIAEDREATGADPNTMAVEQEGAQSVLDSDQYESFIDLTKLPEKQMFGLNEHDMRSTAEKGVLEDQKEMECQGEDRQIVIDQREMNSEKIGVIDMTTAEEFEAHKLQSSQEFAPPHAPQSVVKPLEQKDTGISDETVEEDSTSSRMQALPRNPKVSGLEKGRISIGYSKRKDKYKCFLCNEIGTGRKFEEHVMLHLLWKPYKCLYCSQFFVTRASIGTHVSENHTGQLPKCGLRAIKKAKQFLAEARKKGTCEYLSEKLNDMYWTCMRRKKSDRMSGMEDFEEDQDAGDGKNVSCDYVVPISPGEAVSVNEIQPRSEDFEIKTSPSTSTIHPKSNDPIAPIIVPDTDNIAPLELPEMTTSVCPIQRKQLSNLAKIMDDIVPIIVPDTDDDASLKSPEKKTNAMTYPLLMDTLNDPIEVSCMEDSATLEYPVKKSNTSVSSILVQQLSTPIMQIIVPDTDDTATLESPVKKNNTLILKEQPSHAFERVAKVIPVQRDRPTTSTFALRSPLQLASVSQIQSPVHQLTSTSQIQSPAQQLTSTSQNQSPVHQLTSASHIQSPVHQLTSASHIQSPAQQLTSASHIQSPVHQLTSASHIQSPVQQLTNASHIQSPVQQLTSASHIQSPVQQLTGASQSQRPAQQLTSTSQNRSPVQQLTNTSQIRSPAQQLTSASHIQSPVQQLTNASHFQSLAQQLTSASQIQRPAHQLTSTSHIQSPVQQLISASHIQSPVQQLTSASQIQSPAQQLTNTSQIRSPAQQLTSASHIQSPVQQLTNASHFQSPVQQLISASHIQSPVQQLTSASHIQSPAQQLTSASQIRSPARQLTSTSHIQSPAQQLTSASHIQSLVQQLTNTSQIWNPPILTNVSHILNPVPVLTTAVLPHPQAPKSIPMGSYIILSGNQTIKLLPSSTFVPNVQLQTSCANIPLLQPRQDMNVIPVPITLPGQATVTVNQTPLVSQIYKKDSIRKVNHPKKFSICIMNDYFLCNLCKSKFAQESSFRAHLWNHIHMWKLLCSFCSSSTSTKGWKTLSCSKTDDYIQKLKRNKVAMSSVVEVHLDDEDIGDEQGEAHRKQRNMVEQQAASQASVNKPEIHLEEAISMASSGTVEQIADKASVTAGDDGCQSRKTKVVSMLLSEGEHSEGHQEQSEYGPGYAREMIMSENQPLSSHQSIITAALNVASTQLELPSEILRVQKTVRQNKDLDVLHSEIPPMQETVSQSKDLDVQRSDKTVGSTISQEATKPRFYACGAACGYSTLFGTELKKHVEECKWPGALLCSHCKFKADSPDVLVRHMGKHYLAHLPGVAVFQCSVSTCNFATNILQGFVHHLRNVHPNLDRYTCHFCDECFTEPQPLLRHLHSNILHVVNCKYCSAKDSNKAVIIKHIMESHPEKSKVTNMVKQLLCKDRKENASASRCVLDAHATLQVTVPTSRTTSSDDSRADHFSDASHPLPRVHAGSQITGSNKPTMLSAFIPTAGIVTNTPIIDQTASQNTEGKKVHHTYEITCFSETSLSCQICSFVGKTEIELNVHASKHKAKPSARMLSFSCPECPEDFNMMDSFQMHLKKHNEAIHYDVSCCRICQMEKGSRQNVLNHIKTVHNPLGDGREFVQSVFKTSNSDVVVCSSCQYTCLGTEAMSFHRQKQTYSPGTGTASQCPDQTSKSPLATFCESFALSRVGDNQKPKVTMAIPSNSVYKYPVRCIICTYSSVYKANLQRHMDKNHPEVNVTMEDGGVASPTKMRNVPRDVPSDTSNFQESDVDKLKIGGSFLAKELGWLYEDHGYVYRCLKCHKDFHRKNIIHAHVLSHWNISLWKCATCSYKHARRVMVMEHMKQEHNNDCNMDDIIPLIDSLRKDISSIVGTLVENGQIIQDMAPILGSKYLDSKFRHMYKTVGKKRLCKGCEAEYQSTYNMHRHILKTHLELSLFKCSYCNFSSIERLSVVEHISKEHPQEEVVVCYMPYTTYKIKRRKKKVTSRSSSKDSEREHHLADGSNVTSVKKIVHNRNKPKHKSPAAEVELQSDKPEKNVTETCESDFSNGNMSRLGKTSAPSPLSPLTKRAGDSRDDRDELRVGSNTLDQKLQRLYDGKSSRNHKMVCNVCKQDFPSKYSLHCHLLAHLKINLLACPYCNFEQVEKSKVVCHIKSNHPDDHVHIRHIKVDIDGTVQEFIGDRSRFGRKKKAHKEVRLSQILAGRTSMKSPRKLSRSPEKQSKNVVAVKVGELRKYKCRLCDYMALTKNSVGTHVFKVHENQKTKNVSDEMHGVSASETVSPQTSKKGKVPIRANKKSKAQTSKKSSVVEKKGSACTDSKLSNKGEQLEHKKSTSTDTSDAESTSSSDIKESEKMVDSHAKKSQVEEADTSDYFRCPKCSFTDSQREKVLSHMKSKHSVTNVLSCKYCDAWFFAMNSLKGHISFLHKGKAIRFISMLLEDVTPSKDYSSVSAVKRPSSDDGKSSKDHPKRAKKSSKSLFIIEDEMKTNSKAATTTDTKPPKQALLEKDQGNSTSKEKGLSSEDVWVKSKRIEDGASLKSQDTSSSTPSKTNLNTAPKDTSGDSSEQTVAGNSELSSCVPSSPDNSGDEQTEYYKYLCVYCDFKTSSTLEMKYHIAGHQTERSFSGKVPENATDKEKIKKKVSAILPICKERAKNKLINLSPSKVSTQYKKPEVACEVALIKSNTELPARDEPVIQKSASISASRTSPSRNKLSLKRNRHSPVATKTEVKRKKDDEPSCSSDSSSESEDSEMIQPRKINKSRLIVSSDEKSSDEEEEKLAAPKKKTPSPSKINYCCHLCPFMGRSLYQFRSHLASHSGFTHLNPDISKDSMLTCGFCGFMTESKDHFADHVEKHLRGGIYKCGYCKFDSYHRKNMKSHLNCRHRHKPEKFVDLRVLMRERAQRTRGTASLVNLDPRLRLVDSMTSLQFKRLLDEAGCETMSMPLSVVKVVYQLIGGNIEGISDDELDM